MMNRPSIRGRVNLFRALWILKRSRVKIVPTMFVGAEKEHLVRRRTFSATSGLRSAAQWITPAASTSDEQKRKNGEFRRVL
jgi:hypothetical protein